jgi:hypothetical protein
VVIDVHIDMSVSNIAVDVNIGVMAAEGTSMLMDTYVCVVAEATRMHVHVVIMTGRHISYLWNYVYKLSNNQLTKKASIFLNI